MADFFSDDTSLTSGTNNYPISAPLIPLDYFTAASDPDFPVAGAPTVTILGGIQDLVYGADVDTYKFVVQPDEVGNVTFTFDVDYAAANGVDTVLLLRDGQSNFIQSNDDNPFADPGSLVADDRVSTLDPYMTFTPAEAGDYYISIYPFNYDPTHFGPYSLHIAVTGSQGIQSYGDGTFGNDMLFGDRNGTPADDTIHAYAGNDSISAGDGNDTLYGGDGSDTIDAGNGNDTVFGDDDSMMDRFFTGGFNDGAADDDTIHGGAGNDTIYGGRGDDKLYGEAGRDWLEGGDGSDLFDGGADADTYAPKATWATGIDTFIIRATDSTFGNSDTFLFNGNAASFAGAGVAGGDVISFKGLPGTLFSHGQTGFAMTLGSPLAGGGNGVADLFSNSGDGVGTWYILDLDDSGTVSLADMVLRFNAVITLAASDILGSTLVDPVHGGIADESISGTAAADFIYAGAGRDTVKGGGGTDLLLGEAGADQLFGQAGNDSLDGGSDNDRLEGGAGRDYLLGGDGADKLIGGPGADVLAGGAGKDRFIFRSLSDSGITEATQDQITDFVHGTDKIDLSAIDAVPGGADDAFTWVTGGGFTAPGQVQTVSSAAGALVWLNTDADADPEATILLVNVDAATITAGDFVL